MKKLLKHIYEKKGRIYKNQKIGSGRAVFAIGEGTNGEIGAYATLYKSTGEGHRSYTISYSPKAEKPA